MSAKDEKPVEIYFSRGRFCDLDTIIDTQTKTRIISYMHDQRGLEIIRHEKRFIRDLTDQLPRGLLVETGH